MNVPDFETLNKAGRAILAGGVVASGYTAWLYLVYTGSDVPLLFDLVGLLILLAAGYVAFGQKAFGAALSALSDIRETVAEVRKISEGND